jgi:hypothetical protein
MIENRDSGRCVAGRAPPGRFPGSVPVSWEISLPNRTAPGNTALTVDMTINMPLIFIVMNIYPILW